MRAFIPNYELITPASLKEALALLEGAPEKWQPFAGGTDLMVLLESGSLVQRSYINIWPLNELRGISIDKGQVTVGALTTYTEVQNNAVLREEFPMLCQAASETGGLAIQNRGTLGGNIINASPAADSPPALLAYDAQLELTSNSGSRWIEYHSFHTGYKKMSIQPGELLTRIRLPRTGARAHYYRKVGTRRAQAISKVCLAGVCELDGELIVHVRLAVGSVAPIPLRCFKTEATLNNQQLEQSTVELARETLAQEITPIDDIRSTASYRRRVAGNLLLDFLSGLRKR